MVSLMPPMRTAGGRRQEALLPLLEQTRIIPAVRAPGLLTCAATAPGKMVYFLYGNPEDIAFMASVILAHGKTPILNLDLASGFARDAPAIKFLARRGVQGILSTHQEPLRAARKLGLFAIERTFLIDSAALQSILHSLDHFLPDALEILPAMAAPRIISRLQQLYPALPVVAGGLIQSLRETEELIRQGVTSVSASDFHLWVA